MEEENILENASLLLDENRGIYIPQKFAENFDTEVWGFPTGDENIAILLEGPDHEHYWEAWDEVLFKARHIDKKGVSFTLYQDGDLWAVPA